MPTGQVRLRAERAIAVAGAWTGSSALVERRIAGEPLAHVTGTAGFRRLIAGVRHAGADPAP